jgi:hypothetical protein
MGLLHFETNVFTAKECGIEGREGKVMILAVKCWHWIVHMWAHCEELV